MLTLARPLSLASDDLQFGVFHPDPPRGPDPGRLGTCTSPAPCPSSSAPIADHTPRRYSMAPPSPVPPPDLPRAPRLSWSRSVSQSSFHYCPSQKPCPHHLPSRNVHAVVLLCVCVRAMGICAPVDIKSMCFRPPPDHGTNRALFGVIPPPSRMRGLSP